MRYRFVCLSVSMVIGLGACSQGQPKNLSKRAKKSSSLTSPNSEQCVATHFGLPPEQGSAPKGGSGLVDDEDGLGLADSTASTLPTNFASLVPTLGAEPSDYNTRLFVNVSPNPDLNENFYLTWVLCPDTTNASDCQTGITNSTKFYIPVVRPATYTQLAVSYCVRHYRRHLSGYQTDNDPNCTSPAEGVIDLTFTRPDYVALAQAYDAEFPPKTTGPNTDLSMVRAVEDILQIEADIDEYQKSMYDMGVYIWNYYEAHGTDGTFPISQAGFIEDIHNMGPDLFALNASARMLDDIQTLVDETPNIIQAQKDAGLNLTEGAKPGDCTQDPLLALSSGVNLRSISNDSPSTSAPSQMETAFGDGDTPMTNGTTADTSPILEENSTETKKIKQGMFAAGIIVAAAGGAYALYNVVQLFREIVQDNKANSEGKEKAAKKGTKALDPIEQKQKAAKYTQKNSEEWKKKAVQAAADAERAANDADAAKKAAEADPANQEKQDAAEAASKKATESKETSDETAKKAKGAEQAATKAEEARKSVRDASGDAASKSTQAKPAPDTKQKQPATSKDQKLANAGNKKQTKGATPAETSAKTKAAEEAKAKAGKGKISKTGRLGRAAGGLVVGLFGAYMANMVQEGGLNLAETSENGTQLINGRPAELVQASALIYLMLQDLPKKTQGLQDLFSQPDIQAFFDWAMKKSSAP